MTAPTKTNGPDKSWKHRELYDRVLDACHALPGRFRTSLKVAGISATDLFTLNTALGAAIESSVVDNLNALRELWDPDGKYEVYSFVRQAQVFPDVRLQTTAPGIADEDRIIMGIELKGWFLLAKEGEPSFRYKASPLACAPQDLLVVFPWGLDEVVSGSPRLYRPFIEEARYAAEWRNHYWTTLRGVTGATAGVKDAEHKSPYAYGWSHERAVSTPSMGKCRAIQHGVELRETQRGGFLSGASLSKPDSSGSSSPREPSTRAAGNLSPRPRDYVTERA